MAKWVFLIVLLYLKCIFATPVCTVIDADEYTKILKIKGNLECDKDWYCEETFSHDIQKVVPVSGLYCEKNQIIDKWFQMKCECVGGTRTLDNEFRIELVQSIPTSELTPSVLAPPISELTPSVLAPPIAELTPSVLAPPKPISTSGLSPSDLTPKPAPSVSSTSTSGPTPKDPYDNEPTSLKIWIIIGSIIALVGFSVLIFVIKCVARCCCKDETEETKNICKYFGDCNFCVNCCYITPKKYEEIINRSDYEEI